MLDLNCPFKYKGYWKEEKHLYFCWQKTLADHIPRQSPVGAARLGLLASWWPVVWPCSRWQPLSFLIFWLSLLCLWNGEMLLLSFILTHLPVFLCWTLWHTEKADFSYLLYTFKLNNENLHVWITLAYSLNKQGSLQAEVGLFFFFLPVLQR